MTDPVRIVPGSPLGFRPADQADARLLLDMRNDPFIVARSGSGHTVGLAEHEAWFARVLAQPEHHRLFFLELAGETVGLLRFHRTSGDAAEITVYLLEMATGRGLGTYAIRSGSQMIADIWPITKILARIIDGNRPSFRAFAKAGFVPADPEHAADGWAMLLPVAR